MTRGMEARGLLVALVVPLALLSACGGDSDSTATDPADSASATTSASDTASDTPSDSPSESDTASASPAPDWPACDSVWTEGGKIPAQYKGCLDGSDEVPADNLSCSSGQRIVRYQDTFYGVAGGKIHRGTSPLNEDEQYLEMARRCRA